MSELTPGSPPARDAAPSSLPPGEALLGDDAQHDIAARVARDQMEALSRLTVQPVIAGGFFSIVVGLLLWPTIGGPVFAAWVAARVLISVLRVWDCRDYLAREHAPEDIARRRRRFLLLMACECASWSAMGLLFTGAVEHGVALVMLTALVGVAAVSVFSLGSDFGASGSFVAIVLLPNVAAQFAHGTTEGMVLGTGMLIFLALLLLEARTLAQRMTELLRLRHENAAIAEQRQRALALAEHSSRAKSRFLATVSHEIRTPLNGILGMAQLLQKEVAEPALRSRLDIVAQSARHLQVLIGDLIDLSRVEAGRLRIEPTAVALRDVVREVTGLQAAAAAEKSLRFELRVDPGVPSRVLADAPRVKQVLHNLLGNAIKFTSRGEVEMAVAAAGGSLHFTVRDSGPGVDPALRERIFRPFEQPAAAGAAAGSAARGGLGLGLTISRQLARAMGGDVQCLPADGGGACFRFSMPCRPAPEAAATPVVLAPAVPSTDPGALRGRVLVAEDNDVNAIIVQAMLERFDVAVERVTDGEAALAALQAEGYDLVLMDCQMPGLDGLEATREWRRREAALGRVRTPIVALTANAVVGDRDRCLQAGMDDYLVKPIELAALARALRTHLRQMARA